MAKLWWRYGSMGAGKSIALISVAHNYERIGQKAAIFTAAIDNRFGTGKVTSRIGVSRDALTFHDNTEFTFDLVGHDVACCLVDEAQFLTIEQVKQLHKIAAINDVPVICFGIRTDFMGNGFEGALALGVMADRIEELKTVCGCGKKATFNIRLDESGKRVRNGEQVQIGGDDTYRQACPVCFYSE
jgi:thymidine kinase